MMIKTVPLEIVYKIRHEVMYPKQDFDLVKVQGDEEAIHLGYYLDDVYVSIISIFKQEDATQIRKFATLKNHQNKGYGTNLLRYCLNHFEGPFFLNARLEKASFYESFDFERTNRIFERNGLEYVIMIHR